MLSIDKIIEVTKKWCEEEASCGFVYRLSRCLDVGADMEDLKKALEKAETEEKKSEEVIETTGYAANVDDSLVVECNLDWPNEWKDERTKKVKVRVEPIGEKKEEDD